MSRTNRWVLASAALFAVAAITGCTSQVSGRVVSSTTGSPVASATVTVGDISSQTDGDGGFLLEGVRAGARTGVVKVVGFRDTEFPMPSKSGSDTIVEVPDGTIALFLVERAVEPKPIEAARVMFDGADVGDGKVVGPLALGDHRVSVEASGCEAFEATITIAAGANETTLALSLTPLETYQRFYAAGRFHRDSMSYRYIHPNERKRLSLKKWKAWGSGTQDKSIKFGDIRMLKSWKSKYVKRTYRDVAEIDRTITYQVTDPKYADFGKTYTDNFSQHWVKADGIWYIVHAKGP